MKRPSDNDFELIFAKISYRPNFANKLPLQKQAGNYYLSIGTFLHKHHRQELLL
jgi:hypothetical protein